MDKSRTENLIGKKAVEKLASSSVAVFGLGGVGSYCVETLCRAGVGKLLLCDGDVVQESNLNRQLYALKNTVGKKKAEVAKERCLLINENARIIAMPIFFNAETADKFDFSSYDYIIDCIDNVTSKLLLAVKAKEAGVKIISCMGTGNKLDNTRFRITDIKKTHACPLAKVMRRELKKRGITDYTVLFSDEERKLPLSDDKRTPASVSFVPSVAGITITGYVVNSLIAGLLPSDDERSPKGKEEKKA